MWFRWWWVRPAGPRCWERTIRWTRLPIFVKVTGFGCMSMYVCSDWWEKYFFLTKLLIFLFSFKIVCFIVKLFFRRHGAGLQCSLRNTGVWSKELNGTYSCMKLSTRIKIKVETLAKSAQSRDSLSFETDCLDYGSLKSNKESSESVSIKAWKNTKMKNSFTRLGWDFIFHHFSFVLFRTLIEHELKRYFGGFYARTVEPVRWRECRCLNFRHCLQVTLLLFLPSYIWNNNVEKVHSEVFVLFWQLSRIITELLDAFSLEKRNFMFCCRFSTTLSMFHTQRSVCCDSWQLTYSLSFLPCESSLFTLPWAEFLVSSGVQNPKRMSIISKWPSYTVLHSNNNFKPEEH